MNIRKFLCIDGRTRRVTRYVEGKKAHVARLPLALDGWVLAELEIFRLIGPPAKESQTS